MESNNDITNEEVITNNVANTDRFKSPWWWLAVGGVVVFVYWAQETIVQFAYEQGYIAAQWWHFW